MAEEPAPYVPPQGGQEQRHSRNQHNSNHRNTNNNNRGGRDRRHDDKPPNDQDARPRRGGGNQQNRNQQRSHRDHSSKKFEDMVLTSRKDHAGLPMSGNVNDCHICCQPSDVFGVGDCRHPVCMECCIRMRVLGNSESCPQCRTPIALLYFISAPNSWENFSIPMDEVKHDDSAKYNIRFTNEYTSKCYDSYMSHSCQICSKKGDKTEFPTFGALRHHTANVHQRTFCPICIEHLNILSKDRIAYNKFELEKHMKGTSKEVSGQKGHPPCLFCPERFFDDDFLYRHLRKEHFFCQICETDGSHNMFYAKIEELYAHYRKKHHPCDEPDCKAMGIVFRTDVELGVHKASEHGSASRNVNIDFQFSGRNLGNRIPRSGANFERDPPARRTERITVVPNETVPSTPALPSRIVPSAQHQQSRIVPSKYNTAAQDFPSLGPSVSQSSSGAMPNWRQEVQATRRPPVVPLSLNSGEQFPSLGGANGSNVSSTQAGGSSSSLNPKNNKQPAANTVWGKVKPSQLFKEKPAPPPKPVEETPRRQFIPLPDIWPEGMRERVEARMKGLPDPGNQEPESLDPLFRVEAAKKEKRRAAKKKSKTVPISAFVNQDEDEGIAQPSKFDALSEIGEPKSKNKAKFEGPPTLRAVADSIGKEPSSSSKEEKQESSNLKNNGIKLSTPASSSLTSAHDVEYPPITNNASAFPSLTDIVSGIWSLGRTNQQQPTASQPPPGFSYGPPPGFS